MEVERRDNLKDRNNGRNPKYNGHNSQCDEHIAVLTLLLLVVLLASIPRQTIITLTKNYAYECMKRLKVEKTRKRHVNNAHADE